MKKNQFKNKTVVISGAASGLGNGIAQRMLDYNARTVLLDIDKERLENFITHNQSKKDDILVLQCDVTESAAVKKCLDVAVKRFHTVDFMFNNAGIGGTLPFEEANGEQWTKIINLNIKGVVNGIMHAYPIMKQQGGGHIINTSSISGIIPFSGQSLYNTTKYAVTGLSLTLAEELKDYNIHVSVVCPGMVKTRIFYKPIIGDEASEVDVIIPKGAISVERAVDDILKGILSRKKIIITPKWLVPIYWFYKLTGVILQ
jgi:NADP-dependent 3-hydroxy acid dehydrogenase YdfG